MKNVLKLEEVAMTMIAIYFLTLHNLGLSFWVWALLFFAPDISMLGYGHNPRTGAALYNLFHHKGIAILVAALGTWFGIEALVAIGTVLFAHASFDRIWGYGLKYETGF